MAYGRKVRVAMSWAGIVAAGLGIAAGGLGLVAAVGKAQSPQPPRYPAPRYLKALARPSDS